MVGIPFRFFEKKMIICFIYSKNLAFFKKKKLRISKKLIPNPEEQGILGKIRVSEFFIPIPTILGNTVKGNWTTREFYISYTEFSAHLCIGQLKK